MATQLQLRRGTTAQHSTFTGLEGELTYDTDLKHPVIHDGVTAGGLEVKTYGGAVYFYAYRTANQNILTSTATKIQFNNARQDSSNSFDTATNFRFTVPTGQAGDYFFQLQMTAYSASANITYVYPTFLLNGVTRYGNYARAPGAAISYITEHASVVLSLSDGDFVEANAFIVGTSPILLGGDSAGGFEQTHMTGFKLN